MFAIIFQQNRLVFSVKNVSRRMMKFMTSSLTQECSALQILCQGFECFQSRVSRDAHIEMFEAY